jgi:hypothetical protein
VDLAGNSYYKLSRLVVLKEYRHYGFGGNLVLALHNWVKDDARQSGMVDCEKWFVTLKQSVQTRLVL